MAKKEILVKKTIDVPAIDVWETVRSFDRVERYVPIVKARLYKGLEQDVSELVAYNLVNKKQSLLKDSSTLMMTK